MGIKNIWDLLVREPDPSIGDTGQSEDAAGHPLLAWK
jgi:hypothetical protein